MMTMIRDIASMIEPNAFRAGPPLPPWGAPPHAD
jgi:hypothetical protein